MIPFECPECKKINRLADSAAGKSALCGKCGFEFDVPKEPIESDEEEGGVSPTRGARKAGRREDDEEYALKDDDEPKPKGKSRKPAGKRAAPESDGEEGDGDRKKKKRKGKGKSKSGSEFGPEKRVFSRESSALRMASITAGIFVALGMLTCVLSLLVDVPSGTTVFTVAAIVGGLAVLVWCLSRLTLKVAVHEGGLIHTEGAKERIVLWEEIQSVTTSSEDDARGRTKFVCTLELTDVTTFVYDNKTITDVEELAKMIVEGTAGIKLPQMRLVYDQGEMVSFGRLGFNRQGLHLKKQILEWDEIDEVRIREGYISFRKKDKWQNWCKIAAASIPNAEVFVLFSNEIIEQNAP